MDLSREFHRFIQTHRGLGEYELIKEKVSQMSEEQAKMVLCWCLDLVQAQHRLLLEQMKPR